MAKLDYASGASGAISGASTGAMFGPWGAAAGGLIGGAAGLFGGGRKKKKKAKQVSTLDKNQQDVNNKQYQAFSGEGDWADLYDYNPEGANEVFDKTIANKAYRDLNERAIPSVTGQFRNQGLMNSSYAGDALGKLTRDVQESLDAQRSKYLYDRESEARNAKRQGIENYQNRQNFAYDSGNYDGGGGFNIDSILGKVTPEMAQGVMNWWNKPGAAKSAPVPNDVAMMGTKRGF